MRGIEERDSRIRHNPVPLQKEGDQRGGGDAVKLICLDECLKIYMESYCCTRSICVS